MKVPSLKEGPWRDNDGSQRLWNPAQSTPALEDSNLQPVLAEHLPVRCCEQPAASSWADSKGSTRQGQRQSVLERLEDTSGDNLLQQLLKQGQQWDHGYWISLGMKISSPFWVACEGV